MLLRGTFSFGTYLLYENRRYTINLILNIDIFLMRRSDLGEFEEVVLLTVAVLSPEAYSVAVAEELEEQLGRMITTGAVHAALQRLEKKGFLTSKMGEATQERGGRRKRLFSITVAGSRMVHEVREVRNRLWGRIGPDTLPEFNMG